MATEEFERKAAVQRFRALRTSMKDASESEVDEALDSQETQKQVSVGTASFVITRQFTAVSELRSEESSRRESVSTRIA